VSTVKVLVSNEQDDEVGRELLSAIPTLDVLTYDPTALKLTDVQSAADGAATGLFACWGNCRTFEWFSYFRREWMNGQTT
jgi:hypothetical protein